VTNPSQVAPHTRVPKQTVTTRPPPKNANMAIVANA